jgi:hypothetical protein
VLTAEQLHELDTTGITYMRGALPRAVADAIAEDVWRAFEARGVRRDDRSTWPTGILESKLQKLRKSGVFAPFGTADVGAALTDLLGEWKELDPWGGALISFPIPGPWRMPKKMWHFDFPASGSPDRPNIMRLFGFVNDVVPHGGGTLVIEGSHELVRRWVAAAPDNNAGSSAVVKKRLASEYSWFAAPTSEPTEIDGVVVRAIELTGQAGDVALMLPWTMHNINMNCADQPRFMVTHTVYAA